MKKYLIMTAAMLAIILIFAGCSSGNPSSSASAVTTGSSVASSSSATTGSSAVSSSSSAGSTGRVFTLDELKKYDGQNGNPAYVAVNGIVYDVTNAKDWNSGTHHGHQAGADLTDAIKQSPHGESVLSGLPIVGSLQK